MKFCIYLVLLSLSVVYSKGSLKSLTDSRGQEIIEIGAPIKAELPPGLEEEPSAELSDDDVTSTTLVLATKRDARKTTKSPKAEDKTISSEEEEIKVEKELSEIYKDTDYKSDSSKELPPVSVEEKPIARSKTNFKFQPDSNSRADIEKFRTSIDQISCDRRVTEKLADPAPANAGCLIFTSFTIIAPAVLCFVTA